MSSVSLLDDFYKKAWGCEWPQHKGRILKADLGLTVDIDAEDDAEDVYQVAVDDHFDYTCLENLKTLILPFALMAIKDVLIIRPEYVLLRKTLDQHEQQHTRAFVVTGHPGIGLHNCTISSNAPV